jgi:hypothetical protein
MIIRHYYPLAMSRKPIYHEISESILLLTNLYEDM